jgi:hypothetical protein
MWFDSFYISILSEQARNTPGFLALLKGLFFGAWSDFLALIGKRSTSSSLFIARST